jgi:hypothetical protein
MYMPVPKLVDAWLGKTPLIANDPDLQGIYSADDELADLIEFSPETAWEFILEASARDLSEKRRCFLAAGLLEDLLGKHGEKLISKVELEARNCPGFKALLSGVWQGRMPGPIWARVQNAKK